MKKLRVYTIIIVGIFLLSFYMPPLYKKIFASRIEYVKVTYSPVTRDFIKKTVLSGKNRKVIYSNLDSSKVYTIDEYKSLLPFIYYYDLVKTNNFPKGFDLYAQDISKIKREKSYLILKPEVIQTKVVNLYPLFESLPKYSSLSLPSDLFSLNEKGITFINSKTNQIDSKKSKVYRNIFLQKGAVFPLKEAYGTPSTQKPFDEGYFITDNKNHLFHLKLINNKVLLNKIKLGNIIPKFLNIKEDPRREYYGYILDQNDSIHLLMYDNYKLKQLDIKDYDSKKHKIKLFTSPLNRIITLSSIDETKNQKVTKKYVMDLNYKILKENTSYISLNSTDFYETSKKILLPFKLVLKKSEYDYFYFKIVEISTLSLILSFILTLCYILYIKMINISIKQNLPQIILLSISGLYALIILLIFNKIYTKKQNFKENNES